MLLEGVRDVAADGAGFLVLRERLVELVVIPEKRVTLTSGNSFACAGRTSRGVAPAAMPR